MDPIARGETKSYTFRFLNPDGSLMDLSTKKLFCTMRLADVVQVTKRNTAAGGGDDQFEVTATGYAKIKMIPEDTESIAPCQLHGDIWVVSDDDSERVRVLSFTLPVQQAQTRTFA